MTQVTHVDYDLKLADLRMKELHAFIADSARYEMA